MIDLSKDRASTTADLAAGPMQEIKSVPGRPARREYVEEPLVKVPFGLDPHLARSIGRYCGLPAEAAHVFATDETERFRSDWSSIQIGFVDEPRKSVERAEQLVARVVQRLAESFSHERSRLEGQWNKGEDVSTEELRVSLQRYRSFFDRVLAV